MILYKCVIALANALKIITLESEGGKRHFHSYMLLLFLMKKTMTAIIDFIINVLKLCTRLLNN